MKVVGRSTHSDFIFLKSQWLQALVPWLQPCTLSNAVTSYCNCASY
jgi:hypothetical protein